MLRALIKTSSFVLLLRKIWKEYSFVENYLDRIYQESQAHRLIKEFCVGTKINFKYSLLGKITEINEKNATISVLEDSRFIRCLLDLYRKWKGQIIAYLKTSAVLKLGKASKAELYLSPLKTGSIIVVVAILTNISFSILFHKEIELFDWIMRGLVLFIGLSGLSSQDSWEDIKKTSFFLKRISK